MSSEDGFERRLRSAEEGVIDVIERDCDRREEEVYVKGEDEESTRSVARRRQILPKNLVSG